MHLGTKICLGHSHAEELMHTVLMPGRCIGMHAMQCFKDSHLLNRCNSGHSGEDGKTRCTQ